MRVNVSDDLRPPAEILEDLGVTERGRVQEYLTERVLFHMRPYMPYDTGAMADLQTAITGPTTIWVGAPYAQYVYEGVSRSGNPLNYTEIHHPKAGPHWDRTMTQEAGPQIIEEVQAYVRSAM